MALLPTRVVGLAGTVATLSAATAGGDTMDPGEDVFLLVRNASAAAMRIQITSQVTCNHGVLHDLTPSVPAGADRMIGPLPASRFASPTNGLVSITYPDGVVTLSVAAVRA